jgi:two-component system, sensor histidine kinase and response regulator
MNNSSSSEGVPVLAGVNVRKILQQLHLDWTTYKYIALGFLEQHETTPAKIKDAYAKQDRNQLRILAHAVKGSSGSIGAYSLSEIAKKIENICKNNHEWPDQKSMVAFETYFCELITSLKALSGTPRQTENLKTSSTQVSLRIVAFVSELEMLLEKQDVSRLRHKAEELDQYMHKSGYTDAHLSVLLKFLYDFEYDKAAHAIALFLRKERDV